jgi:hypothetical protein
VEGYQKPSSVCFVCDRAPLYGIFHGIGDHEEVTRLPVLVINGRGHPWCGTHGGKRFISWLLVVVGVKCRASPKAKQGGRQ